MTTKFTDKLLDRIDRIDRRQLKTHMQRLIFENKFLEEIISQLPEGVLIIDRNKKIKFINPAGEFLFSVSNERLQGHRFDQCPFDSQIITYLSKAINSPQTAEPQELRISQPREQLIHILVVSLGEEETIGWLVEIKDLTKVRNASVERVQTEKLKALVTLAAGLAHELGNPLNSLAIHLQLIDRSLTKLPKKTKDRLKNLLAIAHDEIGRLDQIVTHFLQATAPLKPRFIEFDINNLLQETLAFFQPELKKNGIKVEKKLQKNLPLIYLDYIQLRQVFVNIIKNASEAMSGPGFLKVQTSLVDGQIKISFLDNGIGIPRDQLDKIFEPYYTTKAKGSGLGLMIVHRIIKEHQGRVTVESSLGKGTRVDIYLPVQLPSPKLLPPGAGKNVK